MKPTYKEHMNKSYGHSLSINDCTNNDDYCDSDTVSLLSEDDEAKKMMIKTNGMNEKFTKDSYTRTKSNYRMSKGK